MSFAAELNAYLNRYSITASELAREASLSNASLSRFRNGKREPAPDEPALSQMAEAIARLSKGQASEQEVYDTLQGSLERQAVDFDRMVSNLNALIEALEITSSDLSHHLNFDASYLSRIRSGKRKPANVPEFCYGVADFVSIRFGTGNVTPLATLLEMEESTLATQALRKQVVYDWLTGNEHLQMKGTESVKSFLEKLDSFDLNDYIRAIHFDELKVPTLPFQIPKTKDFYTIDGFMEAELAWLRSTALSRATAPVTMYSDMPIEKMSEDADFTKKWMIGLAMLLKKGLHLNMIHDVDRSFNEMMLGLVGWIPLYMTGQVSPYYFRNMSDPVFNHFVRVSGSAAVLGEAIRGHHEHGKYHFSTNKDEIAHLTRFAEDMLAKAQPLMKIYRKENAESFEKFLAKDVMHSPGPCRSILSAPPIYTLSDELLDELLASNDVCAEDAAAIRDYVRGIRDEANQRLDTVELLEEIPFLEQAEFEQFPPTLCLADIFYDKPIAYTFEQYQRHWQLVEAFAETHPLFTYVASTKQPFRNIQVRMPGNEWVLISKGNAPAIHFAISHPKLRRSIEKLIVPPNLTAGRTA